MPERKKLKTKPTFSGTNTNLVQHVGAVVKGTDRIRRVIADLETQEAAIREDPELTPEQRKHRITVARQKARQDVQRIGSEIEAATNAAVNAAVEERVRRPVDADAQARVKSLLERGTTPAAILERAYELGDRETVAALRVEMLWHGTSDGFADASETVDACDRVLAEIGHTADVTNSKAILDLEEALPRNEAVAEFATKAAAGENTPHDRLTMAYALGAGQEEE